MIEKHSNVQLMDLISSTTTPEQYEAVITDLLKGKKDAISSDEMSEAILMLAPIAPAPATFDKDAVADMTEFSGAKLDAFIVWAKEVSVLLEAPAEGRFMVKPDVVQVLKAILDQYPEEE